MKIRSLSARDIAPIKYVEMDNLGDIVVIAGANGAGKSRLKDAITQTFQPNAVPQLDLEIEATRTTESDTYWNGATLLKLTKGTVNPTLESYMSTRTKGGTYTGAVIQIDSQRSINNVQYPALSLSTLDPDDSEIDYRYYLPPFSAKWNELVNRLYQKVASRALKIAQYCIDHPGESNEAALKANPDPFVPYQSIFEKLLPGKKLLPIDPKSPSDFVYVSEGQSLSFSTLSSGEQEVVKISFYILAKEITHCVFLIDEPELHLHPTLTFRLIETLKKLGKGTNQFIFFTHSADLISTYYSTGNVFFIDTDKSGANQAHRLSELIETHSQLTELMSENLGLFAVGKKLIFIEGEESSKDRLTYHAIAQKYLPDVSIVPIGAVNNVMRLKDFTKEIENTVFGIEFYMIRDRDGLNDEQVSELEKGKRLFCLKKRHIESYFLNADILAKVAEELGCDSEWHDSNIVEQKIKELAEKYKNRAVQSNIQEIILSNRNIELPSIKHTPSLTFDSLVTDFSNGIKSSLNKLEEDYTEEKIKELFDIEKDRLEKSLNDSTWKDFFPGKSIFNSFCGDEGLKQDPVKVRELYVNIALENSPEVFQDIVDIYNTIK